LDKFQISYAEILVNYYFDCDRCGYHVEGNNNKMKKNSKNSKLKETPTYLIKRQFKLKFKTRYVEHSVLQGSIYLNLTD